MFDCGMSFTKMKPELYKTKYLLITHAHSDHIKNETYKRIIQEFPRIMIYGNSDVAYRYRVNHIIGETPFVLRNGIEVFPFYGVHDVEVTYYIVDYLGTKFIYATDTCEIRSPGHKLDYFFLESNYDERKLKEICKEYRAGKYDPMMSNGRHFSTQKCKSFYYMNRKNKECPLVELHKSSRFY